MRNAVVAGLMGLLMAVAAVNVAAQVAGQTTLGVPATEITILTRGWSAKKQILDKPIYNDTNERVGEVNDIIIAPDKSLSYAIIGVGGFLGLGEHHVAIPFNQFKSVDGKYVLPGATKDTLKAIPTFQLRQVKYGQRRLVRQTMASPVAAPGDDSISPLCTGIDGCNA